MLINLIIEKSCCNCVIFLLNFPRVLILSEILNPQSIPLRFFCFNLELEFSPFSLKDIIRCTFCVRVGRMYQTALLCDRLNLTVYTRCYQGVPS